MALTQEQIDILKNPNYETKSTSVGEVANLIKVLKSIMKEQSSTSEEIAEMAKQICTQFSIALLDEFVNCNNLVAIGKRPIVDDTLELISCAIEASEDLPKDLIYMHPRYDRVIGFKLKDAYEIMIKYARDLDINESYQAFANFKKQLRYRSYTIDVGKKVNIKLDNKDTSRMYAIIDLDKAENEGLKLDGFHHYLEKFPH